MNQHIYSVGQVNAYIRNMFAQDFALRMLSVKGEISNCKYHRSGHIYFTLKDASSAISCVMFAGDRRGGLAFQMKDGDRVVVTGPIEVYTRDGKYQLYAKRIELEGAGQLYEQFLRLKQELEEMGMFAPEYKQPIPKYVRTLGIVTAPTGAAVQDIRNISLRRNPFIQLILYPALVQGDGAVPSIVKGIETLDALGVDCIIVGRGGGSIEDLWAFNEREVAQAVFDCRTPIISAVGHETDTTITDFVADLRAPTPSAAAELAVADVREILKRMDTDRERLQTDMARCIAHARERLENDQSRIRYLSPANQIREKKQRLCELEDRLNERQERILELTKRRWNERLRAIEDRPQRILEDRRHQLDLRIRQLDGLSPIRKLNQGYSYAEDAQGRNIYQTEQVKPGDHLVLQVTDGIIHSEVLATEKRRREI
ncbi:MAG: exodeoxyribonuclease VII large subunit [Eubacterium sp.]|nr:exodeoxyribonuclease VII large subunit [Eubacterium sp.]